MDFSIHICEYNRSNADYDIIYRPEGSGDYLFLLFVLRLDAVTQELAGTAPALLWATCALGLALFFLYDLTLSRLTVLYRRRRR